MVAELTVALALATMTSADTAEAKRSLLRADSALAAHSRTDPTRVESMLDTGGPLLMPGEEILQGVAAREALARARRDQGPVTWQPLHAVVASTGLFGCTVGTTERHTRNAATDSVAFGRYLSCWRRTVAGEWRLIAHQRNDRMFGAPPSAAHELRMRAPHSSAQPSTRAEAIAACLATDSAFAATAISTEGAAGAFARFVSDDGLLLSDPDLPVGKEEVRKAFDGFDATRILEWTPRRDLGDGEGGLAFCVGESTNRPRRPGSGVTRRGKYLTVFRREDSGHWSYLFDLGSPRP